MKIRFGGLDVVCHLPLFLFHFCWIHEIISLMVMESSGDIVLFSELVESKIKNQELLEFEMELSIQFQLSASKQNAIRSEIFFIVVVAAAVVEL